MRRKNFEKIAEYNRPKKVICVLNIKYCYVIVRRTSFTNAFAFSHLTVQTFGPVTQSSFLQQMGIDMRMEVSNNVGYLALTPPNFPPGDMKYLPAKKC